MTETIIYLYIVRVNGSEPAFGNKKYLTIDEPKWDKGLRFCLTFLYPKKGSYRVCRFIGKAMDVENEGVFHKYGDYFTMKNSLFFTTTTTLTAQ
jgi:hypothetical protein